MRSIYIIENPLMDYVMHESYDWLAAFGAKAGTMQLVEHELFLRIVSASKEHHVIPGGSGSNTARGLAMLYGPSGEEGPRARIAYSGGIGADRPGQEFASVLESLGIETRLALKEGHTGVSAIVVTPDHERTMFTSLGACRDYSAGDLRLDLLRECRYFYSTGYMWDTAPQERALKRAVEEARAYGVRVCFDLADPFVVDRYSERLVRWISGKVDVLFANRRELSRMTGRDGPDEEIARLASGLAPVVAMKVGAEGCIVAGEGAVLRVPGESVACRDTTGAGDSFAAGFIYGLMEERSLVECGRLGNRIASRIVAVDGVQFERLDREEILSVLFLPGEDHTL
jgi:sugar/nucleoside kinase (ribokinase family)